MVPVATVNAYQLRDYLLSKVVESANSDPFKTAFLKFLGVSPDRLCSFDSSSLSLYERCAISGLGELEEKVSSEDVLRLLGQASKIEGTPRPWVSDVFGVLAVSWLVKTMNDQRTSEEFVSWTSDFISPRKLGDQLNIYERDVAKHILEGNSAKYSSACIPLFFHYLGMQRIDEHGHRSSLVERFMLEFGAQANGDASTALLSLMIYVFDRSNLEVGLVPPKGWMLQDLINFLEHLPAGLKRWTWEEIARTSGGEAVQWRVDNEYHVQNLLYILLAPIFVDIADEVYLPPVGQKTPRVDLYLPSLHTIIEVKFKKDGKKSFQSLIGEVAEDASLYRADVKYRDARIVCFLWDKTRATQEHSKFKEGVLKIGGMSGCVVVNAPSTM